METAFHYGFADKQLSFQLREAISPVPGFEIEANGLLHVDNGSLDFRCTAKQYIKSRPAFKGSASTPLTVGELQGPYHVPAHFSHLAGLGLAVSNAPEPLLTLSAEKNFQLLDGPGTVLGCKAVVDVKKEGTLGAHGATIQLSHKMMNFTQQQDVKVTVGADVTWAGSIKKPKVSQSSR